MRKILDAFRRSFSARLSLWVVLFATLILLVAQGVVSMVARRAVREEAVQEANLSLENALLRMDEILDDVMLEADHTEWLVYRNLDNPAAMMDYARSALQGTEFLSGCSISFEPWFYPDRKYYSAYAFRAGDAIRTMQEGADDYQYFYKDWYLLPKMLNQPCWTEPYGDWDEGDDSDLDTQALVSYCRPLTDSDGRYIGTLSLDVSLNHLSKTISALKPYPNSYSILLSRGGRFLVHPDPEKLFYQSIFTGDLMGGPTEIHELGRAMTEWEEGMKVVRVDGKRNYVFFKPIMTTGWSMALVCPEKDVFGRFRALGSVALLMSVLGLLLMFLGCFLVIRRTVRPLSALADQAGRIASGDFASKLPEVNRDDEVGVLSRSFDHMQTSLVSYIDELTRTTEKRVRIEGELQIARDIQMGMVPRTFPAFPDRPEVDLFASITPAKEVGGDLYDFFIQKEKLYFCIGDVSGKGIPASLFMAVARNLFRVLGLQGLPPCSIAREINDTLSEGNDQLMFVTMFIGVVDLETGGLTYCNCGHNPPVLLGADGPVFMDCLPNTSIGVFPGWDFQGQELPDFKGIPLFLYTDGLNEAENRAQEQFGNDRLLDVLRRQPRGDAQTLILRMREAVAEHVDGAPASDDLTMLCLKVG